MKGADADARCSNDIFTDVVNEQGFFGQGIDFTERVMVNQRGGLAATHMAGIDAHRKMADEGKRSFHVRDVDGVGIGKQG